MNILIVKLSAIGDVVHTLPALNALRRHYPHAWITWVVEEDSSPLVLGHRALDRVVVSRRKQWLKALWSPPLGGNLREIHRFIKDLRDTKYDLILDFQGLLKSGILIALSKGERKVGFGKGMEHMEGSYVFLNERIPAVSMEHHALIRSLMLLKAIGVPCHEIQYGLPIRDRDREVAAGLLKRHGIQEGEPLIAINPMAKWKTKLWSPIRFAELGEILIRKYGMRVIYTGNNQDVRPIQQILSAMGEGTVNLAGKTTLMTLAALFEQTDFLISTDTGPMHIAAAVGTPVIALFGPTAPWRTGPFGPGHQIVRTAMPCSPCFKRKCPSPRCMGEIRVDQVLEKIEKLQDKRSLEKALPQEPHLVLRKTGRR